MEKKNHILTKMVDDYVSDHIAEGHALGSQLEAAYLAGAKDAINLAALRGRLAQLEDKIVDDEIRKLADE